MPGIKVEFKQGRQGWYIVADFGDGQPPVKKGPMLEAEAMAMAAELEADAGKHGAVVLDRSDDERRANQRAAVAFFALIGSAVALVILVLLALVMR